MRSQDRNTRTLFALFALSALLASACSSADNKNANPVAGATDGNASLSASNANMNGNMNSTIAGTPAAMASSGPVGVAMRPEAEPEQPRGETYKHTNENTFCDAGREPLSTFSVDVDTASYANARRFIQSGSLPPADAVRVEEFINYFAYDYPQPAGDLPFAVITEAAACPWNPRHRLVRIGLQGRREQAENLPPANLVFLVDVSGSMQDANKLPLLRRSLKLLTEQLTPRDSLAVVTYAGASGLALPSTSGDRKGEINAALDRLEAGGSTNGGAGIRLAYQVARQNFRAGGTNRVILATDGDFNVGTTSESELVSLIEAERRAGVALTVLGFGTGNLNDRTMEALADKGDGNYAYIDSLDEARKVLGAQLGATLRTIAKDVKLQVEFNPRAVRGYRLIGYENRLLAAEDFDDDRKDAGEIGAGHSVTALYEIVPAGEPLPAAGSSPAPLKYGEPQLSSNGGELLTVQLRYKEPDESQSRLITTGVVDAGASFDRASDDFRFASAVALFGMLLRDSPHTGDASYERAISIARGATGADLQGYRADFVRLAERAKRLLRG